MVVVLVEKKLLNYTASVANVFTACYAIYEHTLRNIKNRKTTKPSNGELTWRKSTTVHLCTVTEHPVNYGSKSVQKHNKTCHRVSLLV